MARRRRVLKPVKAAVAAKIGAFHALINPAMGRSKSQLKRGVKSAAKRSKRLRVQPVKHGAVRRPQ